MAANHCDTCHKRIQSFSYHIQCINCNYGFHIRCVGLNRSDIVSKEIWYCPKCIQSNLAFNSIDEDDMFMLALREIRINDTYLIHKNKLFMPFEINDEEDSFTELDPDYQYYSDLNYISNTICDYYLEDTFNNKFVDIPGIQDKLSFFSI